MALSANEARFSRFRAFFGHVLSKTKSVTLNFLGLFRNSISLRAVVSNYRESADSCKNSNFFFFFQKIPLGELFSKTICKSSRDSPVWRKIEKFKIWVNQAERGVKIMQIRAFSKRSYKTTETCFYLSFTGFVTHVLKLLSTYILSRSMFSFHSFYSRAQCNVSYFVDTVNFTVF